MHDEHVGRARHQAHRREVARRVVGHASKQRIDDQTPRAAGKERVAVGDALRDEVGADIAPRAGAVFYHDGLAERIGQALSHKARDDVVRTARGKGHDQTDRARGIVLGKDREREERGADKRANFCHSLHESAALSDVSLPRRCL